MNSLQQTVLGKFTQIAAYRVFGDAEFFGEALRNDSAVTLEDLLNERLSFRCQHPPRPLHEFS